MTDASSRLARLIRSEGSIAVAMGVMNIGTYGFQIGATRLLGPDRYGTVASLMNVLLVIGVLQLGLQTTAARRIAADPSRVEQIERIALAVTYRSALLLGAVLIAAAPAVQWALKLDTVWVAVMVGICAVPITIVGGQAGVLQGERRWWPLAVQYASWGMARLVVGLAIMAWRPTEFAAIVGVAISAWVPAAVGAYALRRRRTAENASNDHTGRALLVETFHNSQALLAFMALSNADLAVVARHVLDSRGTGLYAVGVIVSKMVLFLPQFVVVTAFPTLVTPRERRQALVRSLAMVGLLGTACTAGTALLAHLVLLVIAGSGYSAVQGNLWMFAILGTILAALQLLTFAVLARQGRKSTIALWVAVVALLGFGRLTNSLTSLLWTVIAVDGTLLLVLLVLGFRTSSADSVSSLEPAVAHAD